MNKNYIVKPFVFKSQGIYTVTLKDLKNELLEFWLISLELESNTDFNRINRIKVGKSERHCYLKWELDIDSYNDKKIQVNKVVPINNIDEMEIVLTGEFQDDFKCNLTYKFLNNSTEIDYGLKKSSPFNLNY